MNPQKNKPRILKPMELLKIKSWMFVSILILILQYPLTGRTVSLDIKANEAEDILNLTPDDGLTIEISLDAEANETQCDWWIVAETHDGFYHYDAVSGCWLPEINISYQGHLFDFSDIAILDINSCPKGTYSFYFGTDSQANGTADESLYWDTVYQI
ncbi:MAG: hypothetical protein U9P10_11200 [Thermodesulfobacteriota bacterium]|nr:hypothetical protein [Thermodesulfobacteriota bacterium]